MELGSKLKQYFNMIPQSFSVSILDTIETKDPLRSNDDFEMTVEWLRNKNTMFVDELSGHLKC